MSVPPKGLATPPHRRWPRASQTAVVAAIAAAVVAGCTAAGAGETAPAHSDGTASVRAVGAQRTSDKPAAATVATGALSADEADGLLWMREEEKLARDIYLAMAEQWNVPVFSNIARSEQTHMDALEPLLDRYGLQDPVADNLPGVFSNPDIQALFEELLARGRGSLVEALTVGATIEDLDIVDLRSRATDTPDVARVYANLEAGSGNHLRAFVANLARRGATYAPTSLTQQELDAILSSISDGSGGGGRGGQGGQGGRGGQASQGAGARAATLAVVRP